MGPFIIRLRNCERYFQLSSHCQFNMHQRTSLFHGIRMPGAVILLLLAGSPHNARACTVFKFTKDGRTLIGNNEDAWSINAQVRFEQGRNGEYGAIYFDHFNGHPFRRMGVQLGMNEAGLVFDGLSIQPQHTTPVPGRKRLQFDELMPLVMRTCATVHEAATLFRAYDFSWLTRSMLFFADRNGDYLIVESDTMILGNDTGFAVGNWRMSSCTDPDAIPIPRLQAGRALLAESAEASVEFGTAVLQRMQACRSKLGEGTIFSTLFDPQQGEAHLYFYHDFSERVTFNLKEELAKGERTVAMASLFGVRPEYDALLAYATPFHQRELFYVLISLAALAALLSIQSIALLFRRNRKVTLWRSLFVPLSSVSMILLTGLLLTNEGVYYFGLEDTQTIMAWLPLFMCVLFSGMAYSAWRTRRIGHWSMGAYTVVFLPFLVLLGYWGLLLP